MTTPTSWKVAELSSRSQNFQKLTNASEARVNLRIAKALWKPLNTCHTHEQIGLAANFGGSNMASSKKQRSGKTHGLRGLARIICYWFLQNIYRFSNSEALGIQWYTRQIRSLPRRKRTPHQRTEERGRTDETPWWRLKSHEGNKQVASHCSWEKDRHA